MAYIEKTTTGNSARRDSRSELFLSAMLNGSFGAQSVRIRNISTGGALIESDAPLRQNENVELVRAHLQALASVAWSKGNRSGLKFVKPIAIEYWIPSISAQSQMAVDRRVSKIRSGLAKVTADVSVSSPNDQLPKRIAEEVEMLGRQIDLALDELAAFAPVTVRLPDTLQHLEVVSQALGHLGRILSAENPEAVINQIGMADLKRRLLR